MRVAGSEIEGHYAAHAVPDDHRLGELEVLAHPCQIVGEVLHRIALVGLIALAVPAQIHGHDAVAPFGEVLELWGEVGVIAAPPVHQQDRRLPLPRLLVAQGHAVALQLPHVKCSSHPVRGCSSQCNYTEGCAPPPGRLPWSRHLRRLLSRPTSPRPMSIRTTGLPLAVRLDSERVATGGLAAIAPARAIGAITKPSSDTEATRYVARLLGIRQVVLGVMLWQSRNDRAWLRRMATLNAITEALDAAATLVAVVQQRGGEGRPSAAPVGAALSASAAFLALRAAAS